MTLGLLRGVIAAIPTPLLPNGEPDCAKLVGRAQFQLENGCDGLNLLGTTGEATSFSVAQRIKVMEAVGNAGLPLERFMVGTGAAATADAVELTAVAGRIGFSGALLLPPFYYKGITDDGIAHYIERVLTGAGSHAIPLYLYNFPALSGVLYSVAAVRLLVERFGSRIAGLKDSSGDLAYAEAIVALAPHLAVFPSNEAVLIRARQGDFAGCISATANLNARFCAAAFHDGDSAALDIASSIRALFAELPLVPGIKAVLARITGDDAWQSLAPPLTELTANENATLWQRFDLLPEPTLAWEQ
jgi:4-hydroxy-tetrahydrodipicolinate synthase